MAIANSIGKLPPFPEVVGIEFRILPESDAYCVGSDGSVWTRYAHRKTPTRLQWKRLKCGVHTDGYVVLNVHAHGGHAQRRVHRMILDAFIGPCPEGQVCRHLNGNRTDNRLTNLAWGTSAENAMDAIRHGTMCVGSRSHYAKLSEDDVKSAFQMESSGASDADIARALSVSASTISKALNGQTWAHLKLQRTRRQKRIGAA